MIKRIKVFNTFDGISYREDKKGKFCLYEDIKKLLIKLEIEPLPLIHEALPLVQHQAKEVKNGTRI